MFLTHLKNIYDVALTKSSHDNNSQAIRVKGLLKKISGKTILEIILERLENIMDVQQVLVTGPSEKNQELIKSIEKNEKSRGSFAINPND